MSRTSRLCTPNRVILIEAPHTLPTEPIREGCRHAIRPANELKKGAAWHGDHGAVLSGIPKSFPRLEAAPGFEPGIRALQARALPLGYAATDRARHPVGRRRIGVTRSGVHVNFWCTVRIAPRTRAIGGRAGALQIHQTGYRPTEEILAHVAGRLRELFAEGLEWSLSAFRVWVVCRVDDQLR